MKQYPRKPPRFKESDSIYFLTFCTFKRKPILHIDTIPEFLIDELIYYKSRIKNLLAYTIMPDHIHLLIEIEDTKSMSTFLRDFKKYTSRELRRRIKEDRLLQQDSKKVEPIWQPGTMDHRIRVSWKSNDFMNHLSYLFYNSYKHLKIVPRNFPHHNFQEFVEQGYFDNDFYDLRDDIASSLSIYDGNPVQQTVTRPSYNDKDSTDLVIGYYADNR